MADELEQLHAAALAGVVAKLRAAPAVMALVPEQVFGAGGDDLARAGEWARCVIVTPGKKYGAPPGNTKLLVQRDVWVEMRAESQEVLDALARAVVNALNGAEGSTSEFQHCIHTHSAPTRDGPGEPPDYLTRTDVFGLHCVQPKAPSAALTAAAPPKIGAKVPTAAPPKVRKRNPPNVAPPDAPAGTEPKPTEGVTDNG